MLPRFNDFKKKLLKPLKLSETGRKLPKVYIDLAD